MIRCGFIGDLPARLCLLCLCPLLPCTAIHRLDGHRRGWRWWTDIYILAWQAQMKRCKCWNPNHCDCVHDQCEFIERYTLGSPDKDGYFDITIGAQDKKCLNSTMGPFQVRLANLCSLCGILLQFLSAARPVSSSDSNCRASQLHVDHVGRVMGGVLFEGSWPHPVMTPFNPLKLEQVCVQQRGSSGLCSPDLLTGCNVVRSALYHCIRISAWS